MLSIVAWSLVALLVVGPLLLLVDHLLNERERRVARRWERDMKRSPSRIDDWFRA